MSYLELFDADHKKQNKGYFIQLINVALADGVISPKEEKLLYRLGHKLGFVDEEIHKLIENPGKSVYNPPYELSKRMEQIYEIVRIIAADEQITKEERHIASCMAVASGFDTNESEKVIDLVIKGIHEDKDEEEILKDYLKSKR
jgi:hypothetical protein